MNEKLAACTRVLCASLARIKGSVVEELLAMRGAVSEFNRAHGLRSAFLFSAGWVLQWHEGPDTAIDRALHISKADARHHHLRVLHRSVGPGTLTEPLQIATTHGNDRATDFARRLHRLVRAQEVEATAAPHELWEQLSAPCWASAEHPGALLVRRHVVAVGQHAGEAVDLVRSIAERAGLPLTYQRFASGRATSSDVGAAYVDVPGTGHVTRLQALSPRGLAQPMVRLALRNVHCVVVLDADAGHAAALQGKVAGLIEGTGARPAVRSIDPLTLRRAGPDMLFRMVHAAAASSAVSLV